MKESLGKKRKAAANQNDSESSKRKRNRSDESRNRVVTDINVETFAECRAVEIQALTEVVKNEGGNHMAFQKLPRHMRRRAMSHNIKRIPRRLHQAVKSELEKTKPPGKRPSRCYRRRPRFLLAEYERRKRQIGWLETHIWHAKRFKMIQKWNYKLAFHPNEKSIRACYRAVQRYCLIQDVSYESYIEITGPKQMILDNLSHLTSNKTGPTFAAQMTLSGTRQGKLTLYTYDGYPSDAVGQVTYLWQTKLGDAGDNDVFNCSTLWICCHPSFYAQALVEINKCFDKLSKCDIEDSHQGENQSKVSVVSLKDQLVKFRLFGPSSNLVLSEVLQVADIESQEKNREESKTDNSEFKADSTHSSVSLNVTEDATSKKKDQSLGTTDLEVSGTATSYWWKDYYSSTTNKNYFREQTDVWSQLKKCISPAEAPPNCVLALTVRDPRLMLPPKKNKVHIINPGSTINTLPSELLTIGAGLSPLWIVAIRENVKASKITEQNLNELKNKQLIPGSPLHLGDKESRIPVILIQRPGTSSTISTSQIGYASGWDVVIPSGWAMAFWISLIYRGARVGGIREACSVALQAGSLCEPFDFPDSLGGREQLQAESEILERRHDCRPPAKRPNYTKLGFQSPFRLEFTRLVNEWHEKASLLLEKIKSSDLKMQIKKSDFYVLRDRKCLRLLNMALTDVRGFLRSKSRTKGKDNANVFEKITATDTGREMIEQHSLALVPVLISIHNRGVPAAFGHICLPSPEDLNHLDKDKSFSGPLEKKHKDLEGPIRKEERKIRLKLRRMKKRGKDSKILSIQSMSANSKEFIAKHSGMPALTQDTRESDIKNKMSSGKIITTENKLLSHTSRMVCGFVRNGDFDLGKGHGSGLGFCSLVSLLHLLEQQGNRRSCLVLIRNPTSFQYRFASLSVVL